jgi:hypothetical protein
MTPLDILRRARAIIESPAAFTTGAIARDVDGHWVDPLERRAVTFDVVGAFVRAAGSREAMTGLRAGDVAMIAFRQANGLEPQTVSDWSSSAGHEGALAAFEKAIAFAEAGAS